MQFDVSSGTIIVLFLMVIALITIYAVIKTYQKSSLIGQKDDAISRFLDEKQHQLNVINGPLDISAYIIIMIAAPFGLGLFGYIATHSPLFAMILGIVGIFAPEIIVRIIKQISAKKFEERYARSLEQLGASLRAGMSIMQAVDDTAKCKFLHHSIRQKYSKLSSDLKMGIDVGTAFRRFAEGTESQDANDVALAIEVQNEIGGHEADVIQNVAMNINTRISLRMKVSSIFASSALMIRFMDFVPYIVMGGICIIQKDVVKTFFAKPLYILVFVICLVFPLIGTVINHRTIAKVNKGV